MNPENIMLSEISQTQDKYYMISLYMESKKQTWKQELTDTENILVVARGNVDQDQVKWVKVVKGYKLPVIRWISLEDLIYSIVLTVNGTVLYTLKLLRG